MAGRRLDQALAELFPDYSRSRLQQWIKAGQVQVDGHSLKARDKVAGGETVAISASLTEEVTSLPQAIPLDILYEDDSLMVIHKPAGLVVHPAAGNPDGTLLNALLNHDPGLASVPRAGIIHRLDKQTSGLLVVARSLSAHHYLVDQLQQRLVKREYEALVCGVMTAGGTVDAPIGRHPVDRKRQAVNERGKTAVTHYRVLARYRAHSRVRVQLETGRTHQIRVHMAHIRHPIIGDPVYGGRLRLPRACSEDMEAALRGFRRQALHALRLGLVHPVSGEAMSWEAPLPADMLALIEVLEADARQASREAGL